jgi:hypothetical protein
MAVFLGWRHGHHPDDSLWDKYLRLVALIGGGFPGVFALGLMTRRANGPGVLVGALVSVAVTAVVQDETKTSPFLHVFVAIATCVVVGYIASLLFGGRDKEKNLAGLTMWDPSTPTGEPTRRAEALSARP